MTSNESSSEPEGESTVQQRLDGEWREQRTVQVTVLSDDEETARSEGELKVLESEGDSESAVALSVQSPTDDCVVGLGVNPAFSFAEQVTLVAEQASPRTDAE
jgi:hypothetical protein